MLAAASKPLNALSEISRKVFFVIILFYVSMNCALQAIMMWCNVATCRKKRQAFADILRLASQNSDCRAWLWPQLLLFDNCCSVSMSSKYIHQNFKNVYLSSCMQRPIISHFMWMENMMPTQSPVIYTCTATVQYTIHCNVRQIAAPKNICSLVYFLILLETHFCQHVVFIQWMV